MIAAKLHFDPGELLQLNASRYKGLVRKSKLMVHTLIALPYTPPHPVTTGPSTQTTSRRTPVAKKSSKKPSRPSSAKRKSTGSRECETLIAAANQSKRRRQSTGSRTKANSSTGRTSQGKRAANRTSSSHGNDSSNVSSNVNSDSDDSDGEEHRYYETEEDDTARAIADTYDVPLKLLLQANRKAFPGLRGNSRFKKGKMSLHQCCMTVATVA